MARNQCCLGACNVADSYYCSEVGCDFRNVGSVRASVVGAEVATLQLPVVSYGFILEDREDSG